MKKDYKQIKEKAELEKELALKPILEAAAEKIAGGKAELAALSNKYKGLFYLPVWGEDETGNQVVDKMAIMRKPDRHVLNYASSKIADEGLYAFLEAAMRECFVAGDNEIIEDDDYFIPASQVFNKILEEKKASMVKR